MAEIEQYTIVIVALSNEDGGGFQGFVPDLPGCTSDGETREEAISNTEDAIDEWLYEQSLRGVNVPAAGTAVEASVEREEKLLDAIRSLAEYRESADEEISALKRQLSELIALLKDDKGKLPSSYSAINTSPNKKHKLHH